MAEGKYIVTKGILNNSLIQLEKTHNSNDYLLMLFKYNMYRVLKYKGENEAAEICLAQSKYIANKHGVRFVFDTDPEHYVPLVDPDEEEGNPDGFTTGSLEDLANLPNAADSQSDIDEAGFHEKFSADLVDINSDDGTISPSTNL